MAMIADRGADGVGLTVAESCRSCLFARKVIARNRVSGCLNITFIRDIVVDFNVLWISLSPVIS